MISRRDLIKKLGFGGLFASTPILSLASIGANSGKKEELIYSPIHTPANWQIPSKRREVYLWNRFFAANDPQICSYVSYYVQTAIDNMSHWHNIKRFRESLRGMVRELIVNGDSFVIASGYPTYITILNPDFVEVSFNVLHNEGIERVCRSLSENPPSENVKISHLFRGVGNVYGESIIRPLHLTLAKCDRKEISSEEKNKAVSEIFGLRDDKNGKLVVSDIVEKNIKEIVDKIERWYVSSYFDQPIFYSPIHPPSNWRRPNISASENV
jgi:hypothetical protein